MRSPDMNTMYVKDLTQARNKIDAPKGLKTCRNVLFLKITKNNKYEHKILST